MLKISFMIFLFAALCLTGCNFNESNSDSKDIEKFLLLQNNSLRITDLSISHSTILTYDESDTVIEIPRLKISWKVSGTYDYMLVDGEKYLPVNTEGDSVFEIPVLFFDKPMDVIGDTVAMSKPHEIEYTLTFYSDTMKPAE